MDRASAKAAAEKYNPLLLEPLDKKLVPVVGVPVRIDSHPSCNGVADTVKACQAHGIPVPKVFEDPKVSEPMEQAIVHEWFSAYKDRLFTKLSMGRLLGDLSARLDRRIKDEGRDKLRLALYACHDTTVGGMLKALGCFNDRWPAFTAYVSVELLRKQSEIASDARQQPQQQGGWLARLGLGGSPPTPTPDTKDFYVRLRYNSADLKLPACQQPGNHLEGSEGNVCTCEWSPDVAFRCCSCEADLLKTTSSRRIPEGRE